MLNLFRSRAEYLHSYHQCCGLCLNHSGNYVTRGCYKGEVYQPVLHISAQRYTFDRTIITLLPPSVAETRTSGVYMDLLHDSKTRMGNNYCHPKLSTYTIDINATHLVVLLRGHCYFHCLQPSWNCYWNVHETSTTIAICANARRR